MWQLLRLGMLRDDGRQVARPGLWEGEFPERWDALPAVLRLQQRAEPFTAYRIVSVLAARFLPIEHAVRTILGQVAVDGEVGRQALDRAAAERIDLPVELVDRIEYVFAGTGAARR